MNGPELRAILKSLGLSMAEASRRWQTPYRTVQDWCLGHSRIPGWVRHMLALESGETKPLR